MARLPLRGIPYAFNYKELEAACEERAMGLLKPREDRRKTFLRARMRSECGWADVTIANVSSRGLMLQCVAPIERNSFIEVRYRNVCIVGRVVWVGGWRCGVRTQDVLDTDALLSPSPARPRAPGEERRTAPRFVDSRHCLDADRIAEGSKRFARAFEWTVMVMAAGAAGAFMAQSAWAVLDAPLSRAQTALASSR
jgi:hypothetical protein